MNHLSASLLSTALFAAQRHRDQRRSDGFRSPLINHPLEVACLLAEEGGVTEIPVLQAALLHDIVESDCGTLEEIKETFGPAVAEMVAECSDDTSLPRDQQKRMQLENAPALSKGAKQIRIADKISNLRTIQAMASAGPEIEGAWDPDHCRRYRDWAARLVHAVREANPALAASFDRLYEETGSLFSE